MGKKGAEQKGTFEKKKLKKIKCTTFEKINKFKKFKKKLREILRHLRPQNQDRIMDCRLEVGPLSSPFCWVEPVLVVLW